MKSNTVYECLVADNAEELLAALKLKASNILITRNYRKEFLNNTSLPLSKESIYSKLRVGTGVRINPVFLLMNRFSKNDKQQRKIDSKIQKYFLEESGADLLLYLRQLDY